MAAVSWYAVERRFQTRRRRGARAGGGMTEDRLREWAPDLSRGAGRRWCSASSRPSTPTPSVRRTPTVLVVARHRGRGRRSRRHAPRSRSRLVWVICGLQVLGSVSLLFIELAVAVVAFGRARWGSRATVVGRAACRSPRRRSSRSGTSTTRAALSGSLELAGLALDRRRATGQRHLAARSPRRRARRPRRAVAGRAGAALPHSGPRVPRLAGRRRGGRRGPARDRRPGDRRGCARSRPGWPATCTTWSATRWR